MSNSASPRLIQLATQLADWATPATGTLIYLYGSRVRGDHRPDSDIDIAIEWPNPGAADAAWWSANNEEEFASINATLDNRLELLERGSPIRPLILAAPVVYQDRNVRCVSLAPKPGDKINP